MLTVDDYGAIRRARRDGKSIRQIAREFEHSRRTVRHALALGEPNPGPHTRNQAAPILGPFQPVIDQILADDAEAPRKQRHTAMQVFRRLQDEHGYSGCYGQVQCYVLQHKRRHRETFIPLGHLPGQRLEADFGHTHIDFPGGRRLVPFLVITWAYFHAPFALALPFGRTEAILEGMVGAFGLHGRRRDMHCVILGHHQFSLSSPSPCSLSSLWLNSPLARTTTLSMQDTALGHRALLCVCYVPG